MSIILPPVPSPKRFSAKCPGCGRFASSTSVRRYNGWFNCLYVTTYCKQCGEITENWT